MYAEGDRKVLDKNVDVLIEELLASNINTVFLQAWSDYDSGENGNVESVFFI